MIRKIRKRDGKIADFNPIKITEAIWKAAQAVGGKDYRKAGELTNNVMDFLEKNLKRGEMPTVEQVQDTVEKILIEEGHAKTAKAYILYRRQHQDIREIGGLLKDIDVVDGYLSMMDWKVNENSNMSYSLQGLNVYATENIVSNYWLHKIYPPEIGDAHSKGDFHIHDLGTLGAYTYYGKETIIARSNGKIFLTSFQNLYENFKNVEDLLSEEDDAWAKYPTGVEVLDKDGWTKVKRIVKKAKNKPMRFIKNEGGRSVIVTEDHPMVLGDEIFKEAKDVKTENDNLLTVDIQQLLEKENLFSKKHIFLAEELYNKGIFDFFIEGMPFEEYKKYSDRLDIDGIVSTSNNADALPNKIYLNENLGYLIGFYLADGWLEPHRMGIKQKDTVENQQIIKKLEKAAYELGCRLYSLRKDGFVDLRIVNTTFVKYLLENIFNLKGTSKDKHLPDEILTYNQSFVEGIIAGIIDGDGSINTSRTSLVIRIASRTMLEQMSMVMNVLGFTVRDRNLEGVGTTRYYNGKQIIQHYPLYGISFRTIGKTLPSLKYCSAASSKAWRAEGPGWHKILNNEPTEIVDDYIYDITTETHTLIVNGMWNHNCVGWDLKDILLLGFQGVAGKIESKPAKHFGTALMQIVNYLYTLQGEAAGAQALSNFDSLLAPFIQHDSLSYANVKQEMQKFLFNMNVPTRVGFQSPFTNITMDLTTPSYMVDEPVIIGGDLMNDNYSDYADEMDVLNHAFAEIMSGGDAKGRPFTFPIPTYNITKDFDWNNDGLDPLWDMTAKYGIPYFSNFINSDMKPDDARSMCCRLRLDNRELRKRGGGLFGANPKTGSIGVVTINMPRIGYIAKGENDFFERLDNLMTLAKESLEIKREIIENLTVSGLHPYSRFYLSDVKKTFSEYWKNHFSTIGIIGMNDALLNFMNKSIGDKEGKRFAEKVLDHMRDKMADFQEETDNIFNIEATPAEGSLAPDEKVLVSQSDPKLDEIGPLIDGYLKNNRENIYIVGNSEVLKIPHGKMFTYGFSRKTQKIKKYPVTALVRHPGKSMYEITTHSGRKVKVTGQHSVFVLNSDGMPEEILVSDLEAGVPIAVPKQIEIEPTNKEFNLIEFFKHSSFKGKLYCIFPSAFVEKLVASPEVKKWAVQYYKFAWSDAKCFWRKRRVIPLKLIYDLGIPIERDVLESSKIFYRFTKNTAPINVLIPIDETLGFVVGGLLSEGWLSERSEFTNTDKSFAKEFFQSVEKTFGKGSVHLATGKRKKPRKTRYTVTLSKSIGLFFKEIGFQGKSNEKKIPSFALSSSLGCAAGLLRGFHLGDGSFYEDKDKNDSSIRLYTNSRELVEGINLLLLRFGILTKIRKDKKSEYNSRWKDNHILSVTGADNLEKYFQKILKENLQLSNTHSSREIIPGVPKLIKQVMQKYAIKPADINICKDSFNRNVRINRMSIQYLREIVQNISSRVKGGDETIEKLEILINSDIYWDKVKEIRKLKPSKYVYDFEVDVKDDLVNNFLGGSGLVCLHNTSYRLARVDREQFPDIRTYNQEVYSSNGGRDVEPYYTNSTQLPVGYTTDVFEALDLQDSLQSKYTGGTVLHMFLGEEEPSPTATKKLVRKVAENYSLPYYTVTPTFSVCPDHGYIAGKHHNCPTCKLDNKTTECEVYSRVVGYLRPVNQWNRGKQQEFIDRKTFDMKNKEVMAVR